ncbi:polysaccharide biosynthesis C-terminal domain-containing protein [Pyruvatibacter sp.]|uniref:oligosaccharide flippase family protein n=1 Tax=Pyruvatibacter sp. TaxID=1981328 RepID=UPI0032ED78AC
MSTAEPTLETKRHGSAPRTGSAIKRLLTILLGCLPTPLARRMESQLESASDLAAVLRGAASVMLIRIAGAGITFASMVLLARWMGAFEFGIYAYVWTWVILLGTMAPLGLNTSILRFVPEYIARSRWGRLRGLLIRTHLMVLAAALGASALCAAVLYVIAPSIDAFYILPFVVALAAMPLYAMMDMQEGTSRAFGWVTLAYLMPYVVRPLLLLCGIGTLVLIGLAPDAVTALLAMTAACVIAMSVQAVLLFRGISRTVPDARPRYHAGYWLKISAPMLMFEGAYLLMASTDVLMLGKIEDPAAVAIYFAAARTASLIGFVYFATAARAVPKFAEINASGTREDLQAFLDGLNRMSFWPTFLAALALIAVGPYILALFGAGFETGYLVLAILAIGYIARCTVGPLEYLLSMTGKQMVATRIICLSALGNVALNAMLIPQFGTLGAAIATVIAMTANLAALAFAVRRHLGLSAFLLRPSR